MSQRQQKTDQFHSESEWWRVALGSIGDAVITTDTNSDITFLNPVAESLTGWSLAEASGVSLDTVFRIINEDTRQTVDNPATRALREGVIVGLANHTLLISKDGTERPIDDSAAPIRSESGDVAGVVLVFRDVAERRQQELKIRAALAYADNIIATVRESLVVLDKDLRVRTANRTFYQTFQVTQEETESHSIFDLGNRQWEIPKLRTLLQDIIPQDGELRDFEVEHDFPDIGRKIMLLNARRFVSMDSIPELILLAIEDVSERRQAEAAFRESELRYRRLFETARDGILILDAVSGDIIDSNPYIKATLGYSKEELVGQQLWQIGLFSDKQASRYAFSELQEKGYIRYDDLPLQTKSGKQVDVEFVSNAYHVDGQQVIQCNIRDITERRQLERTTIQAEALADLHRRKDEFLAMLSHELRNPLAPIMNAVQLLKLQEGNESPLQQQGRSIIERQVGQLKVIVDDLLEVSRITTGRIRLHLEHFDVRGTVGQAVESTAPLIDQRGHKLSISLPDHPVWLHADSTRIEQVIVNLLTNAAKFTEDEGQISLTLEQEGNEAFLRVRDTGVGIAPQILPRIFELFTQSERSLDRSQGGLGIGLTVVQRLVEMHRGRIEVFSVLDQGSEFVVRLPTTEPELPVVTTDSDRVATAGSLRVLVVDDNLDATRTLEMFLKRLGHDVRSAYDGPTGLQSAIDYQPDLVLLDIGLPGLDGFEVATRLRQEPSLMNATLVAITGYGQESDRKRSQEAGFNHHLVKHPDFKDLKDILTRVSEKKS